VSGTSFPTFSTLTLFSGMGRGPMSGLSIAIFCFSQLSNLPVHLPLESFSFSLHKSHL
jgi:hypothetical protein